MSLVLNDISMDIRAKSFLTLICLRALKRKNDNGEAKNVLVAMEHLIGPSESKRHEKIH